MKTEISTSTPVRIGGVAEQFLWNREDQDFRIVYESLGQGSPVLLLPAFSTVSTRSEMSGIAKRLATKYRAIAVDFPGFGDSGRPNVNYSPALYRDFIEDFVLTAFDRKPVAVIAAGHSAPYVLWLASKYPTVFSRIVLVAPTWQGPFAVMGVNGVVRTLLKEIVRLPILGQILYKLNTLPSFLKFMYRRHVYVNAEKLTPDFIQDKWESTQQPGGRFAPAAFVTGNLDLAKNRNDVLGLIRGISIPIMVAIAESSPKSSRREMEAIAALPRVESVLLPGSLGMHEEYADAIVEAILPFLATAVSR
ncbi:alpha/beta hydrolase [Rivularia sp. UHCC 0363]|uniref:alpha/beta fold hydrolase n=1 Tax=Rivularia sp. UHCC 0363 TaxID=3110244 RepID=UPI002B21E5F3|nr:alpha/beta hydrolase [Rivularia sp. UHCC 0363]MEA5597221.1 alpha/beta hydrolase [Rivularia sp. UHCC 0363]